MKLLCFIVLIFFLQSVYVQEPSRREGSSIFTKNSTSEVDVISTFRNHSGQADRSVSHSRSHDNKGKIDAYAVLGKSSKSRKSRRSGKLSAKGRFRSRGIGRYGTIGSEDNYYVIEGSLDRYGRKRPTRSKFKTKGREKKYKKKIVDNKFSILGKLLDEASHRKMAGYEANGSHSRLNLRDKKRKSSDGTLSTSNSGSDGSTSVSSKDTDQSREEIHEAMFF
ncbi:unnamed protein product [Heterobilharzia americana]|nr:unnamed protein product [Heterobilharzia americana]